jgi:hypothetical protein
VCRTSAEVMVNHPNQSRGEHREAHKNAKGILVLLVQYTYVDLMELVNTDDVAKRTTFKNT